MVTRGHGVDSSRTMSEPFLPGEVFADRYRIIARLGRGGTGEVWRADDLVLRTPVALKRIDARDTEARERIAAEVRLARQITHPAVCRVFDVGDAGGEVFYSMELIEGEDLATLLRRVGRLPSEKVRDIGRQLCDGLAAAHKQGVLHRDLKPANILVDADGRIRITDFGIAVTQNETGDHAVLGTPAYMAPEQLVRGAALSERTDLYALGAVLFELLVGAPPFSDRSKPSARAPRPSTRAPNVDAQLERVILKALAVDPQGRPASADDMAAALNPAAPTAGADSRWVPIAAALVLVAALAVVVVVRWRYPAGPALTSQDTIVLADFDNATGEAVFDGALKVALAVALEQSPFLKVFGGDRVRETLQLMQRPSGAPLTLSTAREVARREQLKAVVGGSIGRLGSQYVIGLEAINAETGDVMGREQVAAPSKEQVLDSLGTATAKLRERLGESLASIQKFDVQLPRATTASLEALHAYSLALDQGRVIPRVEAIPHLKRAIELDPDFALAHALLSGVYANTGRFDEAPALSRKAFELRDRVSERERYFISWRYYVDAEQAWDKALDLARSWTATYPREAFAFNSLALASGALGQHTRAVDALVEAIRLDPRFVPPHGNLAGMLIAINRFADARSRVAEAGQLGIDFISVRRMAYTLAFIENDRPAMARELALMSGTADAVWGTVWEARTAAFAGRFHEAHEDYQRAVQIAVRDGLRELAAQWTMEDAESHAIAGSCSDARRHVAAGLELGRGNFTLERAARTLALCGDADGVTRLSSELRQRFPAATLTTGLHVPVAAAALALRRAEPAQALALLDAVKPYEHAPAAELWPVALRAQAYLDMKDGPAAAAAYQTILDHRGEAPTSPLYPLAYLGVARAASLGGEAVRARDASDRFLSLWNNADPGLDAVDDARQKSAVR